MPNGLLIRDKQGNTQRVSLDQLQQTDPFLYSQYVKNVAQPQAGLAETQAATGASGASAAASSASAARTTAELPAATQTGEQALLWGKVQQYFDSQSGKDKKVSPDVYNEAKKQATAIGIPGDDFDKKFEQSYTDPRNINYDTADKIASRKQYLATKAGIQSTLEQYKNIPEDQKGLFSKSAIDQVPILGKLLAPQAQEYENQKLGLAAQIGPEVGSGAGSGLRVTQTELNAWAALLPSPKKTAQQNELDLKQLNQQMEAKFGPGNGLDAAYLPQSKGTPVQEKPTLLNQAPKVLGDILGINDVKNLASTVNNLPQTVQKAGEEINQKGALGAPSPELRAMATPGGNMQSYTGNRLLDAAIGGNQAISTERGAAGAFAIPAILASGISGGAKTGGQKLLSLLKGGDKSVLEEGTKLVEQGSGSREAVIKAATDAGKTINGTEIANKITKWGDDAIAAGENAKKVQDQVLQAVQKFDGKQLTPQEAKDIWDTASKGFTSNGKAGNTLVAEYQRTLRDGLRAELEKVAPGFEKGTGDIAQGLSKSKLLKQVSDAIQREQIKNNLKTPIQKVIGNPLVKGAAMVAGGRELLKILGE